MRIKIGPVELSFGKSKNRKYPQRIKSRYDAAQTDHMNKRHWANADSLNADESNDALVRRKLRDRSRYERGSNSYLDGIVEEMSDSVVGTGARLNFLDEDPEVNRLVEKAFNNWSKGIKLSKKLRTGYSSCVGDGEMFLVEERAFNPRSAVQLSYRLLDPERCTNGFNSNTKNNVDGVLIDDNGQVTGYTFSKEHPGSRFGVVAVLNGDLETFRADQVIHLFKAKRNEQHRGIPEITTVLQTGSKRRAFTLATLEAAKISATFSGVLHTTSGAYGDDDSPGGENSSGGFDEFDTFALDNGMLMTLPEGWEMTQAKAEHPTTTFAEFKKELVSEEARSVRMPYNVAAGTSENFNFASGRLDRLSFRKNLFIRQVDIEDDALWIIFQKWFTEARLIPELLPRVVTVAGYEPIFNWFWDGDSAIDPQKESKAEDTMLKNGTLSHFKSYADKGQDWRIGFRQISEAKKLAEELDIVNIIFPETVEVEEAPEADDVANAKIEQGIL